MWLNAASATVSAVPLAMRYFVYPDDSTTSTTSATVTNGTLLSGSEEAAAAAVEAQSPLFTAFLFQFFAYTFNLAMGTVIFICAINPSLYVSQFLSGRVFRPLSRLVFSAYLSHQAFIWFSVQQARAPIVVNVYSLVSEIEDMLVKKERPKERSRMLHISSFLSIVTSFSHLKPACCVTHHTHLH